MMEKQNRLRNDPWHWIIQVGIGYVVIVILLSAANLGSALANSGEWFWMSLASMILASTYFISFQFFGGPKFKMEPSIQHACFCVGCGVGMFFAGTTLGMVPISSYANLLPMAIVAVMGLFLTGAPSNLMVSMAVRAKGINPSLPFVVSNSSNFWIYLLSPILGVALPRYFKQASWNFWSGMSLVAIIFGLIVLKIYGLPVTNAQPNKLTPVVAEIKPASDRGLKWWLLEGHWFSKSFAAMLVITVYLVSFQFFGKFFRLDPVVQHSVYLTCMGLGIFMYSKIIGLFPSEEYKKYTPMAMVFLMGLTIGAWTNNLVMMTLRTPGLNPGLPFIVANTFQILVYIVGHWLALRFSQFNKTVFNWQTGIGIVVVLIALLVIKLFG